MINNQYNHTNIEDNIYNFWENNSLFISNINKNKNKFSMIMPPPNITGKLHMGHALDQTIQDILIRYKRMSGYEVLWIPGADHASIATEIKVTNEIEQTGTTKQQIGREKFLEKAFIWKNKYCDIIKNQIKKLGSSCDWTKFAFTLDEKSSNAVNHTFVNLYNNNYIYKGNKIINWCVKCNTAISDAEVEYKQENGRLYYIKYKLVDCCDYDYVTIATTRPETMFGDTAVAVNKNDNRYKKLIGKECIIPIINKTIKIIDDIIVDKNYGSGVVKITPAHDKNDYCVFQRHNLDIVSIFNTNGTTNYNVPKEYVGLNILECREKVIQELQKHNLIIKIDNITHSVGKCYRCKQNIELLTSDQWFIKMDQIVKKAIDVVKNKEIQFLPKRFNKIYFNWLNNIQDWCISRQLWWGHRIPAYYCTNCNNMMVDVVKPNICLKCNSNNIIQDDNILDTWFSSALWPFSTLGFPNKTNELKYFYPTDVLVTGYDIIFFWVARMIILGLEEMKQIPFKYVFLHGLVRDSNGIKMSKSLGNGIDPIDVINKYGADALRLSLIDGISPGNDIRFSYDKVESMRNFINKIWNASIFINKNTQDVIYDNNIINNKNLTIYDNWIIFKLNKTIKNVTTNIDKFELGIAFGILYNFIWDDFCNWYIEFAKINLQKNEFKNNTQNILIYVFKTILKLIHPYIPFITEKIYLDFVLRFNFNGKYIITSQYPTYNKTIKCYTQYNKVEYIKNIIKTIRHIKSENIKNNESFVVYVNECKNKILNKYKDTIEKLSYCKNMYINDNCQIDKNKCLVTYIDNVEIYMHIKQSEADINNQIIKLEKDLSKINYEINFVQTKLENKNFVTKAPINLVNNEKAKYENLINLKNKILNKIKNLKVLNDE